MEDSEQKLLYDKIANNIQGNIVKINKILSSCKITSNFASNESQEKIASFFEQRTETSSKVRNQSSSEYYDSDKLSELFKLLESGSSTSQTHKPLGIARSISLSSLGTTESDYQDNFTESMKQFEDLKIVLDGIIDCPIAIPDIGKISTQETERKNEFIELVLSLQKLAKELRNIAMTDNPKNKVDLNSLPINNEFLNDLKQLSISLDGIQKLDANKNPISVIPRNENHQIHNSIVSNIYESILNKRI